MAKKEIKEVEKVKKVEKLSVATICILLRINGIGAIHLNKKFKNSELTKEEWLKIINEEGIIINE